MKRHHLLYASLIFAVPVSSLAANSFTDLGGIGPIGWYDPFQSNGSSAAVSFREKDYVYLNEAIITLPQAAGLSGYSRRINLMSPDGHTIIGYANKSGAGGGYFYFRWSGEATLTPLPAELGSPTHVTSQGATIFGRASSGAFTRWTQAGGVVVIPSPAMPTGTDRIEISDFIPALDGQSGVGRVRFRSRNAAGVWDADQLMIYRWTVGGGSVLLGRPRPESRDSLFIVPIKTNGGSSGFVNADHFVIGMGERFFRWTAATGFLEIVPGTVANKTLEQSSAASLIGGRKRNTLDLEFLARHGVDLGGTLTGLNEFQRELAIGGFDARRGWVAANAQAGLIYGLDLSGIKVWRNGAGTRSLLEVLEASLPEPDLQTLRAALAFRRGSTAVRLHGFDNEVVALPGKPGHVRLLLKDEENRYYAAEVDLENLPPPVPVIPETLQFVSAGGVKPSLAFSESWNNFPKKTWNEDFQTQVTSQLSLLLPLSGFDPATVNADTEVFVQLGGVRLSRKMGQALNYTPGVSKASFKISDNPLASKAQMDVVWTAKSLSVKVAYSIKGAEEQVETGTDPLIYLTYPTENLPSSDTRVNWRTLPLRVGFAGQVGSVGLNFKLTEQYDTNSIGEIRKVTAVSSLNYGMPGVKLLSPRSGALVVSPSVAVAAQITNYNFDSDSTYYLQARANQGDWIRHWEVHVGGTVATLPKTLPIAFERLPLQVGENLLEVQVVERLTGRVIQSASVTVRHAGIAGDFYGLMTDATGTAQGTLAFKVTDKRSLTGSLIIQDKKYALKGTVGSDGVAIVPVIMAQNQKVNLVLTFGSGDVLSVTAAVDLGAGPLAGQINRVATQPLFHPSLMNTSSFETVWMMPPHPLAFTDAPPGTGFAVLTVSHTRATKLAGRLADGAAFTSAGRLTEAGELPLFLKVYSKSGGGLAGTVAFDGEAPWSEVWKGNLQWARPAGVSKTLYPQGFATRLQVQGALFDGGGDQGMGHLPTDLGYLETGFRFAGGGLLQEGVTIKADFNGKPTGAVAGFKINSLEQVVRQGTFRDHLGKSRAFYLVRNRAEGLWEGLFVGDATCGVAAWFLLEP